MACIMQYIRSFRLYVSANTVQRCRFRTMSLPIRAIHHSAAPALGNTMDHASRIRIMYQTPKARRRRLCTTHYVSVLCIKSRKPRERAMYYTLRIRIKYQALKAHPRELCTTHYVSVLCIKRRKPAGEGYGVRITYPYYVSSAEP